MVLCVFGHPCKRKSCGLAELVTFVDLPHTHSVLMFDLLATWLIFICSVKSIELTPRNITCMDYGISVA